MLISNNSAVKSYLNNCLDKSKEKLLKSLWTKAKATIQHECYFILPNEFGAQNTTVFNFRYPIKYYYPAEYYIIIFLKMFSLLGDFLKQFSGSFTENRYLNQLFSNFNASITCYAFKTVLIQPIDFQNTIPFSGVICIIF